VRRLASAASVVAAALVLTACPKDNGGPSSTSTNGTTAAPTSTTPPTARRLCGGATPQRVGTVADPALTEISGVVQSHDHPGTLWVHNDSGDTARVFALDDTGATQRQYTLPDANAVDWEEIARSPGVNDERDSLYVGDIGDNGRERDDVTIYAFEEPDPATETTTGPVQEQRLLYPDAPHDAEAMFVDPVTRDLFIVTKELSGQSVVMRKAGGLLSGQPTLDAVATLDLGVGQLVTAADIAADGSAVVLRTYGAAFVFERNVGEDLSLAFGREPCRAPVATEQQGEAIAIDPDGSGYLTISEGTNPAIFHVAGA
jgi:hypothetical protein